MKFKNVEGSEVYFSQEGKITIVQHSFEFGKEVRVFLTLKQFRQIQQWVDNNVIDIEKAWNNGVEDA